MRLPSKRWPTLASATHECVEKGNKKKRRLKDVFFFLYVQHVLWMTLKMMGKLKNGRMCRQRRIKHVFVFAVIKKKYWSLSYKMKAEQKQTIKREGRRGEGYNSEEMEIVNRSTRRISTLLSCTLGYESISVVSNVLPGCTIFQNPGQT